MRKTIRDAKRLIKTVKEELSELDRRTDISNRVIQMTSLNDDFLEDEDDTGYHFGVVRLAACAAVIPAIWAMVSAVIILV